MNEYHLAQINIARAGMDPEDPGFQGFRALLADVNALADDSPGFVWRLQDENGDATSIRVFDDPRLLVNMSLWETYDDLFDFTYKTAHAAEGRERLEALRAEGPGPRAFTFKKHFPQPVTD